LKPVWETPVACSSSNSVQSHSQRKLQFQIFKSNEKRKKKKERRKKKEEKRKKKKPQTNIARHSGEPTVGQGQISHISWVSEGLRNSEGAHREATWNNQESLKRGFFQARYQVSSPSINHRRRKKKKEEYVGTEASV